MLSASSEVYALTRKFARILPQLFVLRGRRLSLVPLLLFVLFKVLSKDGRLGEAAAAHLAHVGGLAFVDHLHGRKKEGYRQCS